MGRGGGGGRVGPPAGFEMNPRVAAEGFYEMGDIRRRLGDPAGAEEAFRRASELGREPQPGLALLRLAQGDVDARRGRYQSCAS